LVTTAGYRVLPHTTDAYIEAYGSTLEEAFSHAARALFDTLCNINSVDESTSEKVQIRGATELTLLYDWLENLLLKFELEGKVYSSFNVTSITRDESGLVLNAILSGELYDKFKHEGKIEVKAVTFHKMEIIPHNSSIVLRFVLDL
jgi:SHS2 domain-containing protein